MPPEEKRPDPDALLAAAAAEEEKRGRLKVFLGAAPGVGKTWEMLAEARRRRAAGEDVVAGLIETHGRPETEAQVGDLPVLARKRIAYRGQILEEFDLDGALARHPGVLLLDELAHTNAPGSRRTKRWQDVAELLEAGISVLTTVNVQHLESLNDDIARITGIRPAETLPDRVLDIADAIELIDLSPADLRARLREGKIYRAGTAGRALESFFKEGNLAALREIALRRAAARVDRDVRDWMLRSGVSGPWPTAERVLALVGTDASGEAVVRQAKRLADALHAPWIALHIEQAASNGGSAVRGPLAVAEQLGADIDIRAPEKGDVIAAVLAAANACNATHLVLGRARAPLWRRLLGRTLGYQLMRRAPDFAIHVVPAPSAAPPRFAVRREPPRTWLPWTATVGLIGVTTAVMLAARESFPIEAADMIYLAVVVGVAAAWGAVTALLAAGLALLAWDFFFVQPLHTVTIESPRDIVTGVVFAGVALLTGGLASRVRAEARAAGARIEGLRRITAFSRSLGRPTTEAELIAEIARQAAAIDHQSAVLVGRGDGLELGAVQPAGADLDEGAWAAARWTWTHDEPAGQGTNTLPSTEWRFLPLLTVRGRLGVLGVRPQAGLDEPVVQALGALADQAAVALERVRLAAESARAEALENTQRLRTALLASLGHDLRTPLAGIQGAASTLRSAWESLTPEARTDLLETIEQDVGRMARFLANIADLTRLESGEVRPRLTPVAVAEIVDATLARIPTLWHVAVRIPDGARVLADPALLEQTLFNILDNAVKYAPDSSIVRIQCEVRERETCILVGDEGVGIAPDEAGHVFDSFFRAQRGDRAVPRSGLGLGLAIARGLVEAMGGHIGATSPNPLASGGGLPGALITICLPRTPEMPRLDQQS